MFTSHEEENSQHLTLLQSLGYEEADKWSYKASGLDIEMELLPTIPAGEKDEIAERFEKWWWEKIEFKPPSSRDSSGGFFENEPISKIYKLDLLDIKRLKEIKTSLDEGVELKAPKKKLRTNRQSWLEALRLKHGENPTDITEGKEGVLRIDWEKKQSEYSTVESLELLMSQPSAEDQKKHLENVFEATHGKRPTNVEITQTGFKVDWGKGNEAQYIEGRELSGLLSENEKRLEALVTAFKQYKQSIYKETSLLKPVSPLVAEKLRVTKKLLGALQGNNSRGIEKTSDQKLIDFRDAFKEDVVVTILKDDKHKWGYDLLKVVADKCKNLLPSKTYDFLISHSKTEGEKLVEKVNNITTNPGSK